MANRNKRFPIVTYFESLESFWLDFDLKCDSRVLISYCRTCKRMRPEYLRNKFSKSANTKAGGSKNRNKNDVKVCSKQIQWDFCFFHKLCSWPTYVLPHSRPRNRENWDLLFRPHQNQNQNKNKWWKRYPPPKKGLMIFNMKCNIRVSIYVG